MDVVAPFSVGDVREVVEHLPRGGFFRCVSRPAPGWGGVAPSGDGVVVVVVVADPVRGAGPVHPLRGRAVTVCKFLRGFRLQGVS